MSSSERGDAGTDEQSSTPFERALKVWSEIGLSDLQKTLDDEGVEIVEKQKASVVGRKELAGRTKEFKKLDDSEKLTEVKGLLKAYQTEVDNLTSRCKYAENCFMKLYKLLAEAPDPKPLLEASIDSVISASESSRLATENARLNELVSKTADYDNIKSKLMKVEMQSIENAQSKVKAKESEMKALMDEKERAWKLSEEELTKQIEELKANNQVTQAQLNTNSNAPADAGGRIAELELVERDLERANARVLEMEKRNLDLRGQLEEAKSETKDAEEKMELEKRISDLEGENVVLAAKIESSRKHLEQVKADNSKKVQALERDLSWKSEESNNLKQKLAQQEDYEEIKQELDILKSIEFQEESVTDSTNNESLEKKLLGRNKKLNNDLTALRVSKGELQTEIEQHKQKITALEKELQETRDLNHKLESDISQLREASGDASGIASSISGSRSGRVSPTTSIIGGRGGGDFQAPPSSSRSNDKTILPIITQQRDRFRQRNHELEQELSTSWQQLTSLRKELETLKKDNLDLYEKNRYVSAYKRSNANTDVEDRYRSVYEEGLSPFQQFRGKETERAISRMGPLERVTYSFTKAVLANRLSRNLFLIYCIGLHLLIMAIMIHGVGHSPTTPEFPGESTGGIADSVLSGDSVEQAGEALAPPPGK
ncbi:hypothetical protein TRICI_001299 [Trichomonascus ciferrii]|uniref:Protein CASP n=1 Tax=Trichomonascus ciferrii TaxID=44093 RepID=A0A642VCH8_9ASCO|nr:hypothetical protein TRICI_001299 [Trichomonascus ciferrii]